MSLNESYALKYVLNEFLRRACDIAKGNTEKSIAISSIWDNTFPGALSRDYALPLVLGSLRANHFIEDGDNRDEIKVTLKGIYYVIDTLKVPPEALGVLSRTDVGKLEHSFLQILYEQTKGDNTKTVDVSEIKNRLGGISGASPILQIAEHLRMKGLIEIYQDRDNIKFGVQSEQIKKYYPPPSAPLRLTLTVNVTANSTTGLSKVSLRKNGKPTGLSVYIIERATGLFENTTESEIVVASDILDYHVETGAVGDLNIESVTLQKDGEVYPLKRDDRK